MRVRMQGTDAALVKAEFDQHQLIGGEENAPPVAVWRRSPGALIGMREDLGLRHRPLLIAPASRHPPAPPRRAYSRKPVPAGRRRHRQCPTARPTAPPECAREWRHCG